MQEDLSRLTRELQQETCPERVLEEVERQIVARDFPPKRLPLAIPFAVAGLVLICGLSIWRWQAGEVARQQAQLDKSAEQADMANQAEDALGLVGNVIASAANDSEKIISDQAVPPLRNGLHTATTKIIKPMEL